MGTEHLESDDQLRTCLDDFRDYNFAHSLKPLKRLTPHEHICLFFGQLNAAVHPDSAPQNAESEYLVGRIRPIGCATLRFILELDDCYQLNGASSPLSGRD